MSKTNIKPVPAPARQEPHKPTKEEIARALVVKREQFTLHILGGFCHAANPTPSEGQEMVDVAVAMADRAIERLYHIAPQPNEKEEK